MSLRSSGKTLFQLCLGITALVALLYGGWQAWLYGQFSLPDNLGLGLIAVGIGMVVSVGLRKIDVAGGLVGYVIAMGIFLGGGFAALLLLLLFFVGGSLASRWKITWKQSQGLAEKNQGRRSVIHAISNGGTAAILGLCAWIFTAHTWIYLTLLAASLASAMGDTLSSELGNVYGRRYFDILSWKPAPRGQDGVVSLEGTLIGAAGSLLITGVFMATGGGPMGGMLVFGAGILGNLADSLLGATLQRWGWLNNHTVNLANTLVAAAVAWMGAVLIQ